MISDLGAYLAEVAKTYDRKAGLAAPAQALLRAAPAKLGHLAPGGYIVIGSGGKGTATFTPWFGFFDPDETSSPEDGLYVAYLFADDLSRVNLTVMQGITALNRKLGRRAAQACLAKDATAIRGEFQVADLHGLVSELDLLSQGFRQRAYEAGCVVAKPYLLHGLPDEETLRDDLRRFFWLHQRAVAAKRALLQASGTVATSSAAHLSTTNDPLQDFKPKSEDDYVAHLVGRTLVKTRRHERLVRQYGEWLISEGFTVSTAAHPRDLVACRSGVEWLIEAKVLQLGQAMEAVRAAMGQLYTYRHFLYRDLSTPRLLALFSEPVGDAFVEFLALFEVESAWADGSTWGGSAGARTEGLAVAA